MKRSSSPDAKASGEPPSFRIALAGEETEPLPSSREAL
jgi:hypothetical protein